MAALPRFPTILSDFYILQLFVFFVIYIFQAVMLTCNAFVAFLSAKFKARDSKMTRDMDHKPFLEGVGDL